MKNFLMHTVDTQVGVFDDSVFVINFENEKIILEKFGFFMCSNFEVNFSIQHKYMDQCRFL